MKREYLDAYADSKISELPKVSLENLLIEELTNLYQDFAQKIDLEQLKYEANRIKEIISYPKYRNWTCMDLHIAFQSMLNGTVDYRKITIKSLQSALDNAFRIRQENERKKSTETANYNISEQSKKEAEYWFPYIHWWMDNNVDPEQVTVDEYNKAKSEGLLPDLTIMWMDSKERGPLFAEKSGN